LFFHQLSVQLLTIPLLCRQNTSSSSTADLSVKDISTSELDKDVKDGDTSGLDTNVKDADTSKASTGAKEGKTAIGKRCFRQLKDLAELNFTAYKNSVYN
jgi:hypothetical protein